MSADDVELWCSAQAWPSYAHFEALPTEPTTFLMWHIEGWCLERATCTMFRQSRDHARGILAEVTVSLARGGVLDAGRYDPDRCGDDATRTDREGGPGHGHGRVRGKSEERRVRG